MKKFTIRLIFFCLPFIAWFVTVILIDPYNYFRDKIEIADEKNIAYQINRPLYQLLSFKKHPTDCIILGDSRANSLDINVVNEFSNRKFTNLAYGGGTIPEIINTFWIIAKDVDLKSVYIGLNFNLYNRVNNRNRVKEANQIKENFFSYLLSKYTNKSALLILGKKLFGLNPKLGIPSLSKEEFWKHQLNISIPTFYKVYDYPQKYFEDLQAISKFCNKKGISLVFFIPPTHYELQKKIQEFNLQYYDTKFKEDIKKLGDVYDFDYPTDLTKDKDNFKDPFHFTEPIGKIVVKELFTNEIKNYSKYSKCTTYSILQP